MPAKWQKWIPLDIDQFWSSPSVQRMTDAGKIGYLALICAQWHSEDGALPDDMEELAIASRLSDEAWRDNAATILRKFPVTDDGRRQNSPCHAKWLEAKVIFEARQRAANDTNEKTRGAQRGHRSGKRNGHRGETGTKADRSADTRTETGTYTETEKHGPTDAPTVQSASADGAASTLPARAEDYANSWNRHRGSLGRVAQFTDSRREKARVRINQGITLEQFERAVKHCALTPFLRGENKQGWKADFDWLIANDTNIARVLEGKYDGTAESGGQARGAGVGRIERGIAGVHSAAEQFGWTEADGDGDADGRLLPAPGDGRRDDEGISARSQQAGREARASCGEDRVAGVAHQAGPEVLSPSERSSGGVRSHGD